MTISSYNNINTKISDSHDPNILIIPCSHLNDEGGTVVLEVLRSYSSYVLFCLCVYVCVSAFLLTKLYPFLFDFHVSLIFCWSKFFSVDGDPIHRL